MSANLLKLLRDTGNLWAVSTEIAVILRMQAKDIVSMELWEVGVWVQRRHGIATVVSYRQLPCWIPAIEQAIETSPDMNHLQQLQDALKVEFQKRAEIYSSDITEKLQHRIKRRRNQLEAATFERRQVELLAAGYHVMFRRCRCQGELDWAKAQMWNLHYWHLRLFPEFMDWLQDTWEWQQRYLQSAGAG